MANKGTPSGLLSIVGRRCACSESGNQEKEQMERWEQERSGEKDTRERKGGIEEK